MNEDPWRLLVSGPARRTLDRLPEKIAAAVLEFVLGPLVDAPRRCGHPLRWELEGLWSARVGVYRVIYELDDVEQLVSVVSIAHRADIYRPR